MSSSEKRIKSLPLQEQYAQALAELLEIIASSNPYEMLAMLSISNLAAFDGISREHVESGTLTAMHVELLQALALRLKLTECKMKRPDLDAIKRLVQVVALSVTLRGMSDSLQQKTGAPDLIAMRLHTQSIRNWAYPQETFDLAAILFEHFDASFKSSTGLSATEIVMLFQSIIRWIEVRAKEALNGLQYVMVADNVDEVVSRYKEKFEKDLSSRKGTNIDELKNYAMAHWNAIPAMNIFLLEAKFCAAMAKLHSLEPKSIEGLLQSLSISFGDLSEFKLDYLHLGNPVWTKPFVRDGSVYFLPVPSLLVSHCIEIMETLLPGAEVKRYEERRSEVLETKVSELFSNRFGAQNVYTGSIFDEENHENDLLCVVHNYAFIVESKSGAIPAKAKLGLELSLASTAKKLIVEASEQALRFADFIQKNPTKHKFKTVQNTVNEVDLSGVDHVVPMGALLSPLTQAYPGWQKLLRTNLVDNVPLVCCFLLTDLGYIFQILDSDVALIHYLSRRGNFEEAVQYYGDEIDVLNMYLECGFPRFDAPVAQITGYGQPLFDKYFMTRGTSIKTDKPPLKRNKTWLELIHYLDRSKPDGWIDLGCALLDVDVVVQDESHEKLQALVHSISSRQDLKIDSCSCIYADGDSYKFLILLAHKPDADVEQAIKKSSDSIAAELNGPFPVSGIVISALAKPNEISVSAWFHSLEKSS